MVLASFGFLGNTRAMPNPHDDVDLTIRMPENLYREAVQEASFNGVSLDELVTEALTLHLEVSVAASEVLKIHREALRRLGEE